MNAWMKSFPILIEGCIFLSIGNNNFGCSSYDSFCKFFYQCLMPTFLRPTAVVDGGLPPTLIFSSSQLADFDHSWSSSQASRVKMVRLTTMATGWIVRLCLSWCLSKLKSRRRQGEAFLSCFRCLSLGFLQVNVPKTKKTFCSGKCKKHTLHKVTQYKKGKDSLYVQGTPSCFNASPALCLALLWFVLRKSLFVAS